MDLSDNGHFRQRLIVLAELFDTKLSPQRQALYFEALRDLPMDAIVPAFNMAARTCKFFPKPVELRTLAVGDSEDATERAWMAFRMAMRSVGSYASLVVDDPALGEAIVAVFQSWPAACIAEFSPEMWASKRKEFGRVYRVCADRGLFGARYLTGICEQQNAGRKDWMGYVTVQRLTGETIQTLSLSLEDAEHARTQIAATSHGLTQLMAGMASPALKAIDRGDTA